MLRMCARRDSADDLSFATGFTAMMYAHSCALLCHDRYGMHAPDDTMPALKGLWKIFSEHYGTEMSNEELSEVMNEYFNHEIRDPMRAQGHECPEWSPEQILQHIECHMIEPSISTGVQIRNLKYIERLLLNDVRLQNSDTGETKVDLKVLKAILDVQKKCQTLYNSKPNREYRIFAALRVGMMVNVETHFAPHIIPLHRSIILFGRPEIRRPPREPEGLVITPISQTQSSQTPQGVSLGTLRVSPTPLPPWGATPAMSAWGKDPRPSISASALRR